MIFPPAIGFDLETWGEKQEYALQPFRALTGKAGIKAASISTSTQSVGRLYPELAHVRNMLLKAVREDLYVVGWNVAFDAAWCIAVGLEEVVFQVKWLDAMLLWRHAVVEPEGEDVPRNKRKSYALAAAMHEFYPDQAGFKDFDDFQATDEASLALLLHRNKEDTRWTLHLAEKFWDMLNDRQQRAALIEARCIPQVAKTKVMGIKSSAAPAEELSTRLASEAVDIYRKLLETSPEVEGINLGSPKQLQTLLYETWGLMPERFSRKTKLPSTDKYALFDLAILDPRADLLKKLREAKNNRTKYAKGILNSLEYNGDGYVRPQAKIFGTYCVPGDVEVLTREGWFRLDEWEGGEIVQIHPDNLKAEFLPATPHAAGVSSEWVSVDHSRLRCKFTYEHTIPVISQKYLHWGVKKASDLVGGDRVFDVPISGFFEFEGFMTPEQLKVIAAVQADGSFDIPRKRIRFTLKKARKVERLREILSAAGIKYNEYRTKNVKYADRVCVLINKSDVPPWLNPSIKEFGPWLFNSTTAGIDAFLDELVHWDGHKHVDGGNGYFTNSKVNADWVCILASLRGRKVSVGGIQGRCYRVHICDPWQRSIAAIRSSRHVQAVTHNADAYCPETVTGFWLARSKGTIFVTGNTSRMTYGSSDKAAIEIEKTSKGITTTTTKKVEVPVGCALHQWKRGREYRNLIQAPPGYVLTEFDFSGQEFRWMAVASRDETMLSLCAPGEDAHSYMGAQIAKCDYQDLVQRFKAGEAVAELQRKLGKLSNLSFQYRISPKAATVKARVDYELAITENEIKQLLATYKQALPGVGGLPHQKSGGYWGSQIAKCKHLGYAETFAGRRVQLVGNWCGREAWPLESTAINYPIQGTGGDQKYLALAVARNLLPKYSGYFYYELHDGLFFIFPEDKVLAAADVFLDRLSHLPYKAAWGVDLPIEFPVDAKAGHSWGGLMDLEKFKDQCLGR